jgi:hypothetical protein
VRQILLSPGIGGRRAAYLRGMAGADEVIAQNGAIALVDRLLLADMPDGIAPGEAADLAICDRDRLLAAIHRDAFGDRIEADVSCRSCGQVFEVSFSLAAFIDRIMGDGAKGIEGPDADGQFRLDDIDFRLPTTRDLVAVATLPPEERRAALLARCVGSVPSGEEDALDAAMTTVGPTLDSDLDATCPHCAMEQHVRFSVESFLLRTLSNELRYLIREVHRVASAYGWTYETILALPRTDRRAFVRLIEGDIAQGQAQRRMRG